MLQIRMSELNIHSAWLLFSSAPPLGLCSNNNGYLVMMAYYVSNTHLVLTARLYMVKLLSFLRRRRETGAQRGEVNYRMTECETKTQRQAFGKEKLFAL